MVKTAGKIVGEKPAQRTVSATFCRGCRYLGRLSGHVPFCDYAFIVGKPRTVRNGKKVELCPRKRKLEHAAGGH